MTTISQPRPGGSLPYAKVDSFDGKHAAQVFLDGESYDHRIDLHLLSPADQIAWLDALIDQAEFVRAGIAGLTFVLGLGDPLGES